MRLDRLAKILECRRLLIASAVLAALHDVPSYRRLPTSSLTTLPQEQMLITFLFNFICYEITIGI